MTHDGSLLILPSGIYGWAAGNDPCDLAPADFAQVMAEKENIVFLLLGTGRLMSPPPQAIVNFFRAENVGLETMDTGAAVRTYNVLLAEGRPVAAALLAVK